MDAPTPRPTRRHLLSFAGAAVAVGATGCRAAAPASGEIATDRAPRHSDRIPDLPVVDQHGRRWRSYRDLIADRIVVCSFFYTRCNGACPASYRVMQQLRQDLSPHLERLSFLSFTLAPAEDDVAALQQHAAALGVAPAPGLAPWSFLTGSAADLEALRVAFGYRDPDPRVDADRTNHAALLTYGDDRTDRWGAMPAGVVYGQLRRGMLRVIAPGQLWPAKEGQV